MLLTDQRTAFQAISTELNPQEQIKTAVQRAKLDWTVSCRIPTVKETRVNEFGEVELTGREIPLENSFHVMRNTDNRHFMHATGRFEPIQNEARMQYFADYLGKGGLELSNIGSLKDGALIFGQAKIGPEITIKGQDAKQTYVTVAGSHDGTVPHFVGLNETMIICLNTFMMSIREMKKNGATRKKHTKGFDLSADISRAHEIIDMAWRQSAEMSEIANKLADTVIPFDSGLTKEFLFRLTDDNASVKLNELVPNWSLGRAEKLITDDMLSRTATKILDSIHTGIGQELSVRQNTAWGVFQGVTYHVDHVSSSNKSDDSRATSAMFGTGAAMKERAYSLVQEYAGIA